jgi:hypothetical protein
MCGCGFRRFFWLRWLLGIVILVLVFVVGVKIGEFKSQFGGMGYGKRGMMMQYHTMRGYPTGMMRPATPMMVAPTTVQTATSTTTK